MAQVNPQLLTRKPEAKQPVARPAVMPQNRPTGMAAIFSMAKSSLNEILKSISRSETFTVEDKANQELVKRIDILIAAVKNMPSIQMGETPSSIQIQTMNEATINRLASQLAGVKAAVIANKPVAPGLQEVRITNPVSMPSFPKDELLAALAKIEQQIGNIKIEAPTQQVRIPEFPKTMQMAEGKDIISALQDLIKKVDYLPKSFPDIPTPNGRVFVENFPPQKVANPVTNININPLRGSALTTAVTVTTALTPLPPTALQYRRGLVVYNNSSTVTIYIGGANMLAVNGMPVPPNSYSPAMDAGPKMIVYARTATGSADVRVLETSNENIGG